MIDRRPMVHFGSEAQQFLYRVAAVAVIDGRVLVQQFENEDWFWCLPGGRVEIGEPAAEALLREMREEMGCEVRIERLLWVVEHFFEEKGGTAVHELGLYFLVSLPEGCFQADGDPWTGTETDGTKLYFRWHPVLQLREINLKPSFLCEALPETPQHPRYVLHIER